MTTVNVSKHPKNMLKVNPTFAIFVLLCLVRYHYASAAIQSFRKLHSYSQKQVVFNDYSFNKGNLVFAVCNRSAKGKDCTIVQEQYPNGKSQRSCNVPLDIHKENANISDKIFVAAFGHDNAILFWDEIGPITFFKLLTIKLDNCQNASFVLPDPYLEIYDQLFHSAKIVTYDDTFEMFIKNSNLSDGAESMMTINSHGIVDKSVIYFTISGASSLRSIMPIDVNPPNKSYVYSKDLDDKYVLAIHKPDGSNKVLTSYSKKLYTYSSVVNDLITLCVRKGINSIMTCTQYDKEGNVKFNITFDDVKFQEKMVARDVYNLPGGGILIVLAEFAKSDNEVDFNKMVDYSIVKMNRKGKKVGSLHLDDLVNADNIAKALISTHIWKNGNEGYCVTVIGQGINRTNVEDELSDLNVVVNCFGEADLIA